MPKTRKRSVVRKIPYARGFKNPKLKTSISAIGDLTQRPTNSNFIPKHYSQEGFSLIPEPTSVDDWLAQYNETGDTYQQFISGCPWFSTRRQPYLKQTFEPTGATILAKYPQGKIYLVPLGNFPVGKSPDISSLMEFTNHFFCCPVKVMSTLHLEFTKNNKVILVRPDSVKIQLTSRFHVKTGSFQLKVDSVLKELKELIPDDALCLIGFTMADLYETTPDLFVAGMAGGRNRVGVFSFCRYNPSVSFSQEHWYQLVEDVVSIREEEFKRIMLLRSCRLMVHEISHLFGLGHCIWFSCIMNGAGHLEEDFKQPMFLCPVDLRKLQSLFGFDVVSRYKRLGAFFRNNKMKEEESWIENRIVKIC
ncbi:Archaemetzincin-2-like isoform X1 [Oopsacas minuta]|uniref:Archaemetzincin-2-like isoform X1 n=1 Tax=Oopsacas minuta TaxID=111878 RepID=A0AAV7K039_9METZ|nr:Archaemetzincin-2-like isoform X1 [Oopsacas minuta]